MLSSLQSDQMEVEAQGTWRWPPGGSYHPHPLTPELGPRLHEGTRSATTHNPRKRLPSPPSLPALLQRTVPKCQNVPPGPSQACPYCRGGTAWHAALRALTPDGNTMAQGLAGWLGSVQIILLIVQSGKQLPRTMRNRQSGDWKISPTTTIHIPTQTHTHTHTRTHALKQVWKEHAHGFLTWKMSFKLAPLRSYQPKVFQPDRDEKKRRFLPVFHTESKPPGILQPFLSYNLSCGIINTRWSKILSLFSLPPFFTLSACWNILHLNVS